MISKQETVCSLLHTSGGLITDVQTKVLLSYRNRYTIKAITTGAYSNIKKKRNQLYIIQNLIKFPMMIDIGSRRRDQQAEKHHQRLAVQAGRIT